MSENLKDLGDIDFVKEAKVLFDASVKSSGVKQAKAYNDKSFKHAKLTLGYMNAFISAFRTKVNFHKFTGMKEKVDTVAKLSKKLKV